jgi:hypothetical protein
LYWMFVCRWRCICNILGWCIEDRNSAEFIEVPLNTGLGLLLGVGFLRKPHDAKRLKHILLLHLLVVHSGKRLAFAHRVASFYHEGSHMPTNLGRYSALLDRFYRSIKLEARTSLRYLCSSSGHLYTLRVDSKHRFKTDEICQ